MPSLLLRMSDNSPFSAKDDDCTEGGNTWFINELKMLFSSRSRFAYIEDIPLVNSSILNYGIDESVSQGYEPEHRVAVIEMRITETLRRFEPRLSGFTVTTITNNPNLIVFEISAVFRGGPVSFELVWDDYIGRLYFNE